MIKSMKVRDAESYNWHLFDTIQRGIKFTVLVIKCCQIWHTFDIVKYSKMLSQIWHTFDTVKLTVKF